MKSIIDTFFNFLLNQLHRIGQFGLFLHQSFSSLFSTQSEWKETAKQCYLIGYKTLPLVGITGFIMGLVLTIQTRPTLSDFGAESWLPAMVSVSIVREIGPVITALICAGKVGSGIGAELGSMNVTEQIDAMEVSGTNPFNYLVVTRILACAFMLPLLTIYNDIISMLGSFMGVNIMGEVSLRLFFASALSEITFLDIFSSLIKTFFFGLAIGIISTYQGYYAQKGTVGVGAAANASVVISSLLIFILDMVAVQISSLFS
jgi:phospholipid/cholesterol/gamma-HCH transport system permease protein